MKKLNEIWRKRQHVRVNLNDCPYHSNEAQDQCIQKNVTFVRNIESNTNKKIGFLLQ